MKRVPFVLLSLVLVSASLPTFGASLYQLDADVVYGHKMGMALTYDVIEPAEGGVTPRYTDCSNNFQVASGGTAYLNSNLGCDCPLQDPVPILDVTPVDLVFEPDEGSKTLAIRNVGPGVLDWNVSATVHWIQFVPSSGIGDADVQVLVDRTSLRSDAITTIGVSSNGGSATIPILVKIGDMPPAISVSPNALTFDPSEVEHTLSVRNLGGGDLNWGIETHVPWLAASPVTGTNDVDVAVTVDRTGLPDGEYNDDLVVLSDAGLRVVPVTMHVLSSPALSVTPVSVFSSSSRR